MWDFFSKARIIFFYGPEGVVENKHPPGLDEAQVARNSEFLHFDLFFKDVYVLFVRSFIHSFFKDFYI